MSQSERNDSQARRLLKNEYLAKLASENRTLLDIGCGGGNFTLSWARHNFKAIGYDYNEEYQIVGRELGADLRIGGLEDALKEHEPDVIFYNHVMEHVRDIELELKLAWEGLKEGGCLVIVVPGLRRIRSTYWGDLRDFFQMAHVFNFTKETLQSIVEAVGFSTLHVDGHIRGIFLKTKHNKNPFKTDWQHYEDTFRFLRNTERDYFHEEKIYARPK
ncbi:hypothetical protein Q669_07015 [Labrenzia sp. C1B10]|nr:hypothetical protein Q669_07015 [Labrenzia sp. C1B10]ERP99862.1 hypothetical protein Q675_14905 [Labrenzia sp. C1B70]